jgi:drug/metabolite transporter (DMT)-like permease
VTAFAADSSGFVALVGYVQVVYAFLFDVFTFNTVFTTVQLLSALFILGVTFTVVYLKLKANQAAKKEAEINNSPM